MTTGIHTIVDQVLGGARIPESAAPITKPSLALPVTRKPDLRRNRKRPSKSTGKRDGRARIIAALDILQGRTAAELAQIADVTIHNIYDHMPRLLKEGIARAERDPGPRVPRRFWRAKG